MIKKQPESLAVALEKSLPGALADLIAAAQQSPHGDVLLRVLAEVPTEEVLQKREFVRRICDGPPLTDAERQHYRALGWAE